ncbi:MAG TPA: P-II family nitrogen regulator [Limnochordia bacterium]
MEHEMILAIVERGKADRTVEAAKAAGAKGGTIFLARGTGQHEAKTFFGLTLETGREIVLIVTERTATDAILRAVIESARLDEPGTGIAFVVPVSRIVGLDHRERLRREGS